MKVHIHRVMVLVATTVEDKAVIENTIDHALTMVGRALRDAEATADARWLGLRTMEIKDPPKNTGSHQAAVAYNHWVEKHWPGLMGLDNNAE